MRKGQAAIDWAKDQADRGTSGWDGICLIFVRRCFGVGPRDGTAAKGWQNARFKHGTNLQPPPAVPVWWTGGHLGQGHVVISTGNGYCYSTDFLRHGKVDKVKIKDISLHWGNLTYRGWSEDINGVRVFTYAALPAVDLSNVQLAITMDFPLPTAGEQDHLDMLRVEHALQHIGVLTGPKPPAGYSGVVWRRAYADWQRRTVAGPYDGIPGMQSLTLLGQRSRNPFRVVL